MTIDKAGPGPLPKIYRRFEQHQLDLEEPLMGFPDSTKLALISEV